MLVFILLLVFLINIPFGAWRRQKRRMSLNWFLAIHIPVVLSIGLRLFAGIEFRWSYLLLFVAAFTAGQVAGKLIGDCLSKKTGAPRKSLPCREQGNE